MKHVPVTRSMRNIVASRHLRSIKTCPYSMSHDISLSKRTSFSLFSNLPPEIRAHVWAFALLEPHLVELELLPFKDTLSNPQPSLQPWSLRNKTPHPLLSTCIESRGEVLKRYWSSGYLRYNSLPINFTIHALFIRNLDFGFAQGYWPLITSPVRSGDHSVPLLRIFECVESLVISRESILNPECDAENIIRHCFPNLCLINITVDFCTQDEPSSNHHFELLQHPEDDRHISVLGAESSTCYWDAIYASRVKANMQRRFARQKGIHKNYIPPIVKVVSVCERSQTVVESKGTASGCHISRYHHVA